MRAVTDFPHRSFIIIYLVWFIIRMAIQVQFVNEITREGNEISVRNKNLIQAKKAEQEYYLKEIHRHDSLVFIKR